MPDLEDGEIAEIKGSAALPYILKNTGGVYSCTCPAWRNQSTAIERRTCKHLRQYRGEEAELDRLGGELPAKVAVRTKASSTSGDSDADTPGFLLAHSWENDVDLTGWWISEKLDGVRAWWNGKRFISRQGNEYMAPEWFVEALPKDVHLDGELWLARKAFQRAVSIVRRQDKNADWKHITFVVFDAPRTEGTFEDRVKFVDELMQQIGSSYARAHVHEPCRGSDHLREELARVEALGGEGLMLRKPKSKYETGRSSTLLKVKSFHDAEAQVMDHQKGTGKHSGRMGALLVMLADGTRFAIGTGFSDHERENPPPVGSIVTFRYQELTDAGVPRFPSYVRMRTDVEQLPDNLEKRPAAAKAFLTMPAAAPALSKSVRTFNGPEGETWEVTREGEKVTIKQTTTFASDDEAIEFIDEQIQEQLDLGYSESTAPKTTAPASSVKESPVKTRRPAEAQPESEPLDDDKYRRFQTADKFWEIAVEGTEVHVRFGALGTDGQTKSKSLKDGAAAQKCADDLIAGKLAAGYQE